MNNLQKLQQLAISEDTKLFDEVKERLENQEWLKESKMIAIKILKALRDKGLSQKQLAETLGVSPQQVNKWVKGNEKMTLDSLVKLQNALDIPILASYYEKNSPKAPKTINTFELKENIILVNHRKIIYPKKVSYHNTQTFNIATS